MPVQITYFNLDIEQVKAELSEFLLPLAANAVKGLGASVKGLEIGFVAPFRDEGKMTYVGYVAVELGFEKVRFRNLKHHIDWQAGLKKIIDDNWKEATTEDYFTITFCEERADDQFGLTGNKQQCIQAGFANLREFVLFYSYAVSDYNRNVLPGNKSLEQHLIDAERSILWEKP